MINVCQDSEGLGMAALELMEHALTDPDVDRQLRCIQADDFAQAEKILGRLSLSLSPGYYDRVLYLLWLKDRVDAGVSFSNISADEADGMTAMVRARGEFHHKHPPCPGCGERLSHRGQKHCFGCGRELR